MGRKRPQAEQDCNPLERVAVCLNWLGRMKGKDKTNNRHKKMRPKIPSLASHFWLYENSLSWVWFPSLCGDSHRRWLSESLITPLIEMFLTAKPLMVFHWCSTAQDYGGLMLVSVWLSLSLRHRLCCSVWLHSCTEAASSAAVWR